MPSGLRAPANIEKAITKAKQWLDPGQDSVLEPAWKKMGRGVARGLGIDDPASQAMAIAAPLDVAGTPGYLEQVRKTIRQMQARLNPDLQHVLSKFIGVDHAPGEREQLIKAAIGDPEWLDNMQGIVRSNLGDEFPVFRGKSSNPDNYGPALPGSGDPITDARSFSLNRDTAKNAFASTHEYVSPDAGYVSQLVNAVGTPRSTLFPGNANEYELLMNPLTVKEPKVEVFGTPKTMWGMRPFFGMDHYMQNAPPKPIDTSVLYQAIRRGKK